ncbi:MAG: homocysteine S-methyltransferase family protein [Clostridiales bacterium]|jgi:5-methyltetrahydrofolate--homocysteine methyltransferase|nr:homocysteine S-methyltransferase family protein [Clostridiales bacterium]
MDIIEDLKRKILVFDGGMGSLLQARGLPQGESPSEANLSMPDAVISIHKEYVDAGADVLTTNTFDLSSARSKAETVAAAAKNCLEAIRLANPGREVHVAFDIGPSSRLLEPLGDLPAQELEDELKELAIVAKNAGCDLALLETMTDPREVKAAILAAKAAGLPVVSTMTFDRGGRTLMGTDPKSFSILAESLGAVLIGQNCGFGPDTALEILPEFMGSGVPVLAQPNAGLPEVVDGAVRYSVTPDEFAGFARELCLAGAAAIGGCCGTTPAHIKAAAGAVSDLPPAVPKGLLGKKVSSGSITADLGEVEPEWVLSGSDPEVAKACEDLSFDDLAGIALDSEAEILGIDLSMMPNEDELLPHLIMAVQEVSRTPIVFAAKSPIAARKALKACCGRPGVKILGPEREGVAKEAAEFGALEI